MKKIYDFLQAQALGFCILFGLSPGVPTFLQKNFGDEVTEYYLWTLTIIGITVFLLCLWWLKAEWVVRKSSGMAALTFGSAIGMMIGISALLDFYGFSTGFYLLWRETPTLILEALMVIGVGIQLQIPKQETEK